ncbi:unnamed protein product [Schistosoma margrebowiei]|uniref:Uncharacterized protein n=1 Tax=Schistosoma margrebowiei TaxID=48269 RepID=A0A183MWN3_9TREM|nr:unnamed protein product [Schistosoma margrebowiei]
MKTLTSEGKHRIQWTAQNQLEDLDFAHDMTLTSHTHQQIHMKTTGVAAASESVSLNIHIRENDIPKYNTENTNSIAFHGENLEDVESTWEASSMNRDADVKTRIGKAKATFLQLKNISNSKQLSVNHYQCHNLQYERQDSQFYCR